MLMLGIKRQMPMNMPGHRFHETSNWVKPDRTGSNRGGPIATELRTYVSTVLDVLDVSYWKSKMQSNKMVVFDYLNCSAVGVGKSSIWLFKLLCCRCWQE